MNLQLSLCTVAINFFFVFRQKRWAFAHKNIPKSKYSTYPTKSIKIIFKKISEDVGKLRVPKIIDNK